MRIVNIFLIVVIVAILFISPSEAYRKRKGFGYKTKFWIRPPDEELKIEVQSRPPVCTRKTKTGDTIKIHYTGKLKNGQVFDSSLNREPIQFQLGANQVIPGWEQGLLGMCEGEKRKITIPPSMGYGERGYPPVIPGGATLEFLTELISFGEAPKTPHEEPPLA